MTEILKAITENDNKGTFLELITIDIFKDQKFTNVRRQKSGSQYGYDVIGYKNNECWKAECKNLNKEATINDIAPKLVWHFDSLTIDRFVIVSVNGISNDLYHLLHKKLFSFPIEIWCGEYLEKIVSESPNALKRLAISNSNIQTNQDAEPLIFKANELKFGVVYSRGLPFSYDYFSLDNEIIKAYSEQDFRLTAAVSNPTNRTFTITEIIVRTLKFKNTNRIRILRQFKQKGIIEPIKLTFIPKTYSGGEVELNNGKLIELKSHTNEYVEFKLSQKCEPGYYDLIFEINCMEGDRSFSLFSQIFSLHKKSLNNNIARLCVVGKYYDTPVEKILKLDEKTWLSIKQEYSNQLKYLGPTINDIINKNRNRENWTVNLLKMKKEKQGDEFSLTINPTRKSKLLVDLKIPIEEKIHSQEDSIKNVMNSRR